MKKLIAILCCLCLLWSAALAEGQRFDYRFAEAGEAAELLLANRAYYEGFNQEDLNFRMQKKGATLAEYEAFAAAQTRDYTDEEKAAIDGAMAYLEDACDRRGYALPGVEDIVFIKTTMAEECDAAAYTHGTQIFLGEDVLSSGMSANAEDVEWFRIVVAHELFHCLTRNHPDFRAMMYGILGFTVAGEDLDFAPAIRERMISNPDVEHHDAYAAFDIGGQMRNCVAVFTSGKPFEKPGDSFFDDMVTGLVPVDDPSVMYTSEDAANFWEVFGRNTDYVIDPEETLADNFAMAVLYGPDGLQYPSPDIIEKIDACLKGNAG